ncbi:hypothetical protein MMC27_008153 [Xylographa pallens]|nr:hypothetical protein [Xylographa pallens]
MAHPTFRGTMTAVYNTFWFIGGIPGTFVPYGTSTIIGSNSWRISDWAQITFSGITPTWLMANDRHEEALNIMAKYHGEGNRNSPIIQLEYREMLEDTSVTGFDKRWWDYRELFNSLEIRYRTMLVLAIGFFGQWSGNGPGRRPQFLVSTGIVTVIFAIITALNATNIAFVDSVQTAQDGSQAKAEIAIIFIFGFAFAAGYRPLQGLYPVECLRYESRAKEMGSYNFWSNITSFYNTFVTGIAFTGAGWKYYFLFIF